MKLKFFVFFTLCMCFMANGFADVVPMSKYGSIQNVQNYSTNPYWNPNTPYGAHVPTPVYATGPSIQTADCQNIVAALVTEQCLLRSDNCRTAQLKDIRPAVMVQLSRMPNGNYATACVGFLDDVFDKYVQNNSYVRPSAEFVATMQNNAAIVPNPNVVNEGTNVGAAGAVVPQWVSDMAERRQELKELQAAAGE